MFAEQTGRRRGGGVLRLTRAGWVRPMIGRMEGPLSWRSLAVPTLVALVVWAGFAGMLSLGGQISAIGTEPGQADWTLLARLILGATVIVAAAYALRIWAGRLDLIALIVWTVWFAFDAFDPTAIIPNHGLYQGMAGWFSIVDSAPPIYRPAGTDPSAAPPLGPAPDPRDHSAAANHLCELGSQYGIECAVVAEQTEHDWQGAAKVLAEALPWLAGKIGSPGAPPVPLPGAPAAG